MELQIIQNKIYEIRGRRVPMAFTQDGVAMLSGVLRSPTAIEVNISIMQAFVTIRHYIATFYVSSRREKLPDIADLGEMG